MLGLVRHLRRRLSLLAIPALGGLLASDLGVELGNSLVELGLGGGVVGKRLQVGRCHSIRRSNGSVELNLGGCSALGGIVSRGNLSVECLIRIVGTAASDGVGKVDPAQAGNRGGRSIAISGRICYGVVRRSHARLGIGLRRSRGLNSNIGSGLVLRRLSKRRGGIAQLSRTSSSRNGRGLRRGHSCTGVGRGGLSDSKLVLSGSNVGIRLIGHALGGVQRSLRVNLESTRSLERRRSRIKRALSSGNIGRVRGQLVLSGGKRAFLVANAGASGIQRTLGSGCLALGDIEFIRFGSHDTLRRGNRSVGSVGRARRRGVRVS